MKGYAEFIEKYEFSVKGELAWGTWSDMHLVLKKSGEKLTAYLYLSLPAPGRRERKTLENALKEKFERYGAALENSENASFLRIDFPASDSAVSAMERCLSECDGLLRPYGREMGILCAFCKKELQDEKPSYKEADGLIVPVCSNCAKLETAQGVKKVKNRRDMKKTWQRKGIFGFVLGMAIFGLVWYFLSLKLGGIYFFIVPFFAPFFIKFMCERFGGGFYGISDKNVVAILALASILTLLVAQAAVNMQLTKGMLEAYENTIQVLEDGTKEMEDAQLIYNTMVSEGGAGFLAQFTSSYLYVSVILPAALSLIGAFLAVRNSFRR